AGVAAMVAGMFSFFYNGARWWSIFMLIVVPPAVALSFVIDEILVGLTYVVPIAIAVWLLVVFPSHFFARTQSIAVHGTVAGHLLFGAAAWLLAFKAIVGWWSVEVVAMAVGADALIDNVLLRSWASQRVKDLQMRSYVGIAAFG